MREKFPGYYRLSKEEVAAVWQECLFILDANVLLNLYRYPTSAKDQLLELLDSIRERV